MLEVFAASFAWWCDDLAAGLGAEALIAGIGKYLQVDAVGKEIDQAGITGLGDVGDRAGTDFAAEQQPPVCW